MADTIETRVAVLEQIARETAVGLSDIRAELRGFRGEMAAQLREVRQAQRTDFRWIVGITLGVLASSLLTLIGLVVHGLHWI